MPPPVGNDGLVTVEPSVVIARQGRPLSADTLEKLGCSVPDGNILIKASWSLVVYYITWR